MQQKQRGGRYYSLKNRTTKKLHLVNEKSGALNSIIVIE